MHLIVINPNTTASMTRLIGGSARSVAAPGTTVTAVNPDMGPASIESHYDEVLSVPGLLAEIARAQAGEPAADGFVIACFGDPGLDAARELADGPVVGIAEAAMHAASFLGRGFSVVTTLGRTAGRAWDLAERYGMTRFCRNVRACEIPVLALEDPASDAFAAIVAESAARGGRRRGRGDRAGVRGHGGPGGPHDRGRRCARDRRCRGGDEDRRGSGRHGPADQRPCRVRPAVTQGGLCKTPGVGNGSSCPEILRNLATRRIR